MSEGQMLYEQAALGIDVQSFLRTPVGIYLERRAKEHRQNALEQLSSVHCGQSVEILRLQYEARIPELFMQWLSEAIASGFIAEAQLNEQEAIEND